MTVPIWFSLMRMGVGHALFDTPGEDGGVGDEEIVAHQLGGGVELVRQGLPVLPVTLIAAVLDGDDGVFSG